MFSLFDKVGFRMHLGMTDGTKQGVHSGRNEAQGSSPEWPSNCVRVISMAGAGPRNLHCILNEGISYSKGH